MATDSLGVSLEMLARIVDRLAEIERERSVRILYAAESGSRAWGFASPDSDYDIRFIYAHPRDRYLSVNAVRDVIECPVTDMLDVSGWDIRKALGLLLKGNPALSEWLRSPVVYRDDLACMQRLRVLAARASFRRPMRFHYLGLGRSSYESKIASRDEVVLKKYFYALRPALALRWLRLREDVPPTDLPRLLEGLVLESGQRSAIGELVEIKSRTAELDRGKRIAEIDRFIEDEFREADALEVPFPVRDPDLAEDVNVAFRDIVNGVCDGVPF